MLDNILILIIVLFLIIIIVLLFKYFSLKNSIKDVNKKIRVISKQDTNLLIYSSTDDKDLIENINLFNQNLSSINDLKQKIIHEENELKNTITNLSHDLRTPITTILGYTQLLKSQNNLNEKQEEYLLIIESRMKILKTLIEELFNYSLILEKSELNLKAENITPILEESIVLFYEDFKKKNINVSLQLLEEPVIHYVDRLSLKRICINIINNALKYGKEEMIIIEERNRIIFQNKTNEIDKIDVQKLFDRFFTVAKSRTNGSIGLGLTISKLLIEKMNGSITAEVDQETFKIIITFKQ